MNETALDLRCQYGPQIPFLIAAADEDEARRRCVLHEIAKARRQHVDALHTGEPANVADNLVCGGPPEFCSYRIRTRGKEDGIETDWKFRHVIAQKLPQARQRIAVGTNGMHTFQNRRCLRRERARQSEQRRTNLRRFPREIGVAVHVDNVRVTCELLEVTTDSSLERAVYQYTVREPTAS